MYAIGDRIVHPMHGAGIVEDIVRRRHGEAEHEYYVFRTPAEAVVVLIPVDSSDAIGVRPLADRASALNALETFASYVPETGGSWNRRYRENMQRLRSGQLTDTVAVVKTLMLRDRERALSTGERKMLAVARNILLSELTAATGTIDIFAFKCVKTAAFFL